MKAQEFNERYPVGTPGTLHRDSGENKKTAVRGEAFETENGDAVAFFVGVSGYYAVECFES